MQMDSTANRWKFLKNSSKQKPSPIDRYAKNFLFKKAFVFRMEYAEQVIICFPESYFLGDKYDPLKANQRNHSFKIENKYAGAGWGKYGDRNENAYRLRCFSETFTPNNSSEAKSVKGGIVVR